MATLIDGKQYAATLRQRMAQEVSALQQQHNLTPGLTVVLVGEDPASQVYVRNKGKQAKECGMRSSEHRLPLLAGEGEGTQVPPRCLAQGGQPRRAGPATGPRSDG